MTPSKDISYLYWIYAEGMTDITKEGYVGISVQPLERLQAHKRNALKNHYSINSEFKKHLLNDNYKFKVMVKGGREYISELEYKLRPVINLGWNLQVGGKHNKLTRFVGHNMSKEEGYNIYITLANKSKVGFDKCWQGDIGLQSFLNWYQQIETKEDHIFWIKHLYKKVGPDNVCYSTREYRYTCLGEKLYSHNLNMSKTIKEWGEYLNIRPNTISLRIIRGWTVDEALGLSHHDQTNRQKDLVDVDRQMMVDMLENTLKTPRQIEREFGYNSSLRRILTNFNLPSWMFEKSEITLDDGRLTSIRLPKNPIIQDFTEAVEIYEMWVYDNCTVNKIASETGRSYGVIGNFVRGIDANQ